MILFVEIGIVTDTHTLIAALVDGCMTPLDGLGRAGLCGAELGGAAMGLDWIGLDWIGFDWITP